MARKPTKKSAKTRGKPPRAPVHTPTADTEEPIDPDESSPSASDIGNRDKITWAGVLLIIYVVVGTWGQFDFSNLMGYYDLFADALLAGRLHIAFHPAQGYIHDMIPFEGRYYIQWGPLPGIFHAIPKVVGLALSDRVACILIGWFTSLAFLAIMVHLRKRFSPEVSKHACRWFFVAFALATPTALIALRGTVYHESIGAGALCILVSLFAFARAIENGSRKWAANLGRDDRPGDAMPRHARVLRSGSLHLSGPGGLRTAQDHTRNPRNAHRLLRAGIPGRGSTDASTTQPASDRPGTTATTTSSTQPVKPLSHSVAYPRTSSTT